jgi:hypothetical protein
MERALTFHDLRDTGLTHIAVRGDSAIAIQWAGGHSNFKTTQGHIDRGKVEARRIGDPLPPLPAELLRDTAESDAEYRHEIAPVDFSRRKATRILV